LNLATSKPIPLTSNSLEFEVIDDPIWSDEKLRNAIAQFESARAKYVDNGWDRLSMQGMEGDQLVARIAVESEMQRAVETMRVLDTEASLAKIVQFYRGVAANPDSYNHILWQSFNRSTARLQ
jgi:hypothetical protein